MRVDLLGDAAVVGDTGRVGGSALGGRRARVVLTYLALAGGPVTAASLAAAIWGDSPPATWPVALRGTIRSLRMALAPIAGDGQAVIATTPTGYCLAAGVEVDVLAAYAAVRRAGEHQSQARPRAVLESVESASSLRGSDLMPGEDAEWLAPHRAALDAAALDALALTADAHTALGEHSRAIDAASRAVAAAPFDERAHRLLIRALHRAGDRSGAVRAYEACRVTLADELGVDPSAETVAAYLEATSGQLPSASARPPVTATPFVGREDALGQLARAVADPGLVTVTGQGGVGKSRLAAIVAARADGVAARYWVSLGAVAEDVVVAPTVALGLDFAGGTDDGTGALVEFLAGQGRVLLVLDGADLAVDGVATLAAALLEGAPLLSLLVTNRTPLDLDGETVVEVAPLPAPESAHIPALLANPQVRLLADRVRAAGGSLTLDDPDTVAAVVDLCRRCAGLPLALELAAAQLADMSVGDLLDQIGDVASGQVRAVAASSYALLEPDEAAVFRRFAVLDGPVPLGFARRVLAGDGVAPPRVVRILHGLAARALITIDRSGPRWRYSQDDDLHAWAAELLGEESGTSFDHLLDAIDGLLPQDPAEPPQGYAADVTAVLAAVRSGFRAAATGRADAGRALELTFRMHRYWAATSMREGRYWTGRLLDAAPDSPWRKYGMFALGYLGYWAGDTDAALDDLTMAVTLFGDEPSPFVARALIYLAGLCDDTDRPAEAVDVVRRSIAAAEPFGINLQVAAAMGMGSVLAERGDPAAATHCADAVARCRDGGSVEQLASVLPTAAMICWQVGALAQGRAFVAEAMPMHTAGKRIARVVLLSAVAGLALADDDVAAAVEYGRTADAEAADLGVEREVPLIRSVLARALLRQGDLADATDRALAAVDSAVSTGIAGLQAVALETAALVGRARDAADADLAALLGTAAAIRRRGRPAPPAPLAADLDGLPVGPPVPPAEAVAIARRLLRG